MKNLFKKSTSLFLAVLMVLSCWVWFVAPEKAEVEAGNITLKTNYTVEVSWTVSNRAHSGGDIQYKTLGDGWGSESNYKTALASMNDDGRAEEGTHTYSWETDEFPTVVRIYFKGGFVAAWESHSRISVNYIKINGKEVFGNDDGKAAYTLATSKTSPTGEIIMYPHDASGTTGNLATGYNWARPKIVGFVDNDAVAPDINVTLNKIGGQDITKSGSFDLTKYTCYNQYGVKVNDPATYFNNGRVCTVKSTDTYVAGTFNSDDQTDNTDIVAAGGSSDNVTIKPGLQVSDPQGSDGKATYYLVRKYVLDDGFGGEQTSKASAKINVTYPYYDVKFNGVLGTAKITAGEDSYTQSYTASKYHGGKITLPSKTEAEGYTFYGYWTKEQPTSGNASYNALTADFAKPCSTEDYNEYKKTGTVDGDIVTDADGNKWYDAGKQLDSSTHNTIDCDGDDDGNPFITEWHGWWLSKDLSIKFYDVDGSFLGEKTVKAGQTQSAIEWPTSKYTTYTSGSMTFTVVPKVWENFNGEVINSNSYTFMKDLILTPQLTDKAFVNKYTVTFKHPNNGASIGVGTNGTYDYRADIKTYADTAKSRLPETPANVNADLQYSYELLGWTSVEPTSGYYHVLLEDADFDVNGKAIGLNNDWVVRDNATYYAVYRRHTKTYVVNFYYKDATGTDTVKQVKFKYGSNLAAPTESVPYNYVTKGYGYTFDKWVYSDGASADAYLGYSDALLFTKENIAISNGSLDDGENVTPIDITAIYGEGVPTPYTVKFDYIKNKEDYSSQVTVKNEQYILQTTVDNLKTDEKWDDGESLYTFAGQWEITEGAATKVSGGQSVAMKVGDTVSTADLVKLTPTSNITFKAVYANPVPFFTVTYIDGAKTFSDRVLQDSNVPAWTEKVTNDNGTPDDGTDDFEEDKIYVPADYEGDGGTYEFQGWYDENNNKVTTESKVTGNLTLRPQFKFVPDTFTIKFMSYDGQVQLAAGSYEKGQSIEMLTAEANRAANARNADETYTYLFLGWDKPVPTFCEGYDVTFIAQYKAVYKYYDVKWYNSKLVDGKWTADKSISEVDGEEVETNLLATTHHTYNSKLYTPSVDSYNCLETAPAGQSYVFAGWYYNDAEGNAVKYERSMTVTGEMEFYATYTLTDKIYTVTTVVKGAEAKYSVASGKKAEISDPQAGYVDATYHDAFAGWYTDAAYENEFNLNTAITADTKIYAKFEKSEHEKTLKELVTAPTYYALGAEEAWCECNRDNTKQTIDIPMLKDTKAPTGTIYLGGNSWSSTDEVGGAALDEYDENGNAIIEIYANADTDIIITSNDTGDVDPLYNPAGTGKGVRIIQAFAFPADTVLTADNYGAAQQITTTLYENTTQNLTNNANYAVKVGDIFVADLDEDGNPQYNDDSTVKFKPLESGEAYILYYYVRDKATTGNGAASDNGNILNVKVRTAKFIYDNVAPTFTITGDNDEALIPTYCGTATVAGLEKDVVLTVNDTKVDVNYEDGEETGTYTINWAEGMDNVMIVATDKAGNTFSKKIKVSDHSYYTEEVKSTCSENGYKKTYCLICGDVKENIIYETAGHVMGQPVITPADCINNGYSSQKCENCDYDVVSEFGYTDEENDADLVYVVDTDGNKVTEEIEGETYFKYLLFPAYGHDFELDENAEIVYVTVTESTCKTKGSAEAICKACDGELDGGKLTKELDLNPENHEDVTETEVLPDCVNDGYYTKACSCGVTLESKTAETDPETYKAKGHGTIDEGTAEWYVRTEPTCYQKGEKVLKCLVCSNFVTVDGVEITEEIAETGEHVKIVANPDTYKTEGVVKYKCATEGCPYKYDDKVLEAEEELETYTVIFYAEDGTTELKKVTVTEGDSLVKTQAPEAPAKASTVEFKYTFAGWINGDKTVKFPYAVTANITLKASYKESKIMYTHKFLVPTEWTSALADEVSTTEFATLVGAYGTERVPSAVPSFTHKDAAEDARLKKLYTFEFKGWKDSAGNLITDFTVVGDAQFTAYFVATPIKYTVTYYNGTDYVWHTDDVTAGETVTFGGTTPTKAYDETYHYAFEGWYTDAGLTTKYVAATNDDGEVTSGAITADTRLYAKFTATEHSDYVVNTKVGEAVDEANPEVKNGIVQKADCLLPELTEYICACGHTKKVETKAALGHDMGEYAYDEESGKMVAKCSRCDHTDSYKSSVTIEFVNDNGITLQLSLVERGKTIKFAGEAPTKAADKEYTYTFAGWKDKDGNVYVLDAEIIAGTEDAVYTAYYNKTARTYTVKYVEVIKGEYVVLDTHTGLAYGADVPVFKGDVTKLTVPEYTTYQHYVFDKWNIDADAKVTGDLYITPVFKGVDHETTSQGSTGATCTEKGGVVYKCLDCGYSYRDTDATQPALGHLWDEGTVTLEPDYKTQTDGIRTYTCLRCDATKEEAISGKARSIKVTVVDDNGAPIEHAEVRLIKDGETVKVQTTDNNGTTIFTGLDNGNYSVYVVDTDTSYNDIVVNEDGSVKNGDLVVTPEKEEVDTSCKCSCHKDTFWGMIFRFFQKIIKLFTGKASCCACPDSRI